MALHQRRRWQRLGLPECLAVLLIGIAIAMVALWLRSEGTQYARTNGKAVECTITWTHYNAPDMRQKVALTYQYEAGATTHTASWTGFWPEDTSPNALTSDKLDVLRTRDYPLVVFYDPDNPSQSSLHETGGHFTRIFGGMALGFGALALVYCAAVYPVWKNRH